MIHCNFIGQFSNTLPNDYNNIPQMVKDVGK